MAQKKATKRTYTELEISALRALVKANGVPMTAAELSGLGFGDVSTAVLTSLEKKAVKDYEEEGAPAVHITKDEKEIEYTAVKTAKVYSIDPDEVPADLLD